MPNMWPSARLSPHFSLYGIPCYQLFFFGGGEAEIPKLCHSVVGSKRGKIMATTDAPSHFYLSTSNSGAISAHCSWVLTRFFAAPTSSVALGLGLGLRSLPQPWHDACASVCAAAALLGCRPTYPGHLAAATRPCMLPTRRISTRISTRRISKPVLVICSLTLHACLTGVIQRDRQMQLMIGQRHAQPRLGLRLAHDQMIKCKQGAA
jgi:hypothetical protein